MTESQSPQVRLIAPSPSPQNHQNRQWPWALPERGRWRVSGVAGSGVSSFLVDAVLQKLNSGADPAGVLVIAASKESAARLRRAIVEGLTSSGDRTFASTAPVVRSIHSVAFALLRSAHEDPIRMISGADQDAVIRELLAGHAKDGRGHWPRDVTEALTYVGFARQLRDILLRSAERGITGEKLQELGERYGRGLWTAAGRFQQEYDQIRSLAGSRDYSASELIAAALATDAPERHSWHTVIVDDAQHLDPFAGELIARILPRGSDGLAVVGGDPQQSVFHFRGASSEFLESFSPDEGCDLRFDTSRRNPERSVWLVDSDSTHQALIADRVRRAHLNEGLPYSEIAVIVRSTAQIATVRRALLSVGVPVHIKATDVVLSEQRIISNLLLGVRALDSEADQALKLGEWEELILGPVGGADPVTLRRLIRGLRRYSPETRGIELLIQLLTTSEPLDEEGLEEYLTERELSILFRLRRVFEAGRAAIRAGGGVEEILWAVWEATELSKRLMAIALRGGATGSQADRDLDSVMALFDAAGDFAERRPQASISSFVRYIKEQELPTGVRDRRTATPQAVSLLTAHGAVGREFEMVIVAGVQEGEWPTQSETGSLFAQEDLLDLLDAGIEPGTPVSHVADRLAEEKRLFHSAVTRARSKMMVTAVHNENSDTPREASRFITEFAEQWGLEIHHHAPAEDNDGHYEELSVRVLSVPSVVAELRRALKDPAAQQDVKEQAARQLARLARAGVPGAHPDEWADLTQPSTDEPLESRRMLSPSLIEGIIACPLRAVLGRIEDEDSKPMALLKGTIAHAYLEARGRGVNRELASTLSQKAWAEILDEPAWREELARGDFAWLLDRIEQWLAANPRELVAAELKVNVQIGEGVGISGRIDRLERDSNGLYYIVDLKTGKHAPSQKDMHNNMQLAAYQLALNRGRLVDKQVLSKREGGEPLEIEMAQLVYPASETVKITTREQVARSEEEHAELAALLPQLAQQLVGPQLLARVNSECKNCPITIICPVNSHGRSVSDVSV